MERKSLRTRLTLGVLSAVAFSLLAMTWVVSRDLRVDMEAAISAQQYSTVSLLAAEIDRSVRERVDLLHELSRTLTRNGEDGNGEDGDGVQKRLLEAQGPLLRLFNLGVFVTDAHGIAVASVPEGRIRVGTDYSALAYTAEVLQRGHSVVTEPLRGNSTGVIVVAMAVPITEADGTVLGALVGVINLEQPNFLDEISTAKYGLTGDFVLTAPVSRVTIASSDRRRTLKPGPERGINPIYDRYIDGFDGSGIAVSSRGVEELSSSRRIPATGWLMQAVLPTSEAFAPIHALQRRIALSSAFIMLIVGGLAWLWVRGQLRPLQDAAARLGDMGQGTLPRLALPVRDNDEIGQLTQAFNDLLAKIEQQEAQAIEIVSNRRLRKILHNVPGMVFQYRSHAGDGGDFLFASEGALAIYGLPADAVMADALLIRDLMLEEDSERLFGSMRRSAENMTRWQVDYRIRREDGRIRWLRVDALPERDPEGVVIWFGVVTDITATKQMEAELRIAAATFQSHEGLFITDTQGVILRVNRAFSEITGYAEHEVIGHTPSILRSGRHDASFYTQLWQRLAEEGVWSGEIWNKRKSGEVYPEWVTISAVRDADGTISHYVAAFRDITERKETEERIYRLAYFDPLTNLPNRRLLGDRIQHAIVSSQRSHECCALFFLDIDHFKLLNDTKGHDVGDRLLADVALRLTAALRHEDTVARLGGDEFVVMLERLSTDPALAAASAALVAEKLRAVIAEPYDLDGYRHLTTSSIGVTIFQGEGQSVDALLKQADVALYEAKAAGRNTARFFDPAMQHQINERLALEAALREAIEQRRLTLWYQPQVDATGTTLGAEALLRWIDKDGRIVPTDRFIPLAEETGLIHPIGRFVLQAACEQLAAWASEPRLAGLVLAINISARQFAEPDFVSELRTMLVDHHVPAGRLKLELTESVVLEHVDEAVQRMEQLREIGLLFALDDFGTGYSSLSYLKRLPVDQVKIDKAFVRDVCEDAGDAAIAQTIVTLGHVLGISIIAEGVETEAQLDFLQACGCDAYQGYLFGKPMPVDEFERFAASVATA
jgi:diguanylate cyclase (GGDEF)-like protein/PAS domain S-box-containing protein